MKVSFSKEDIPLFSVFALMVFWEVIQDVLPYVQYVFLLGILFFNNKKTKLKISSKFYIVITIIFIHGLLNVFLGEHKCGLLITQLGVISFCYIAYNSILSVYNVRQVFEMYWRSAIFVSLYGIIHKVIGIIIGIDTQTRLTSLMGEPAGLCYFLAPIVVLIIFWYINPSMRDEEFRFINNKWGTVVILLAYFGAFSSVGYFGLFVAFIIAWWAKGISLKKVFLLVLGAMVAIGLYSYIPDVQIRVDDSIKVLNTDENEEDFTNVNLSTYTLYNNAHVTYEIIKETNGLGIGLGGYQVGFDKHALYVPLRSNRSSFYLNREDANSLFLRLISELGVVGILVVLWWLIHYRVKINNKYMAYSYCVGVLFVMFLLRSGNYVTDGRILFVCLYTKIYFESLAKNL